MNEKQIKLAVATTASGFALYAIVAASLSDDMIDMLIQAFGLLLIFGSSMLIALESAKAQYLETLKLNHTYETNRVTDSIKGSFRIVFTDEARALKSRKQDVLKSIENLKKSKVTLWVVYKH